MKLPKYMYDLSKEFIVIVGVLMVVLLGFIDYLTGYEMSFSLFYLSAIISVSWFVGKTAGLLISLFSAIVWFIADSASGHVYSHQLIPYWNTTVRLGFFLVISRFLVAVRNSFEREKELAQTDPLTGVANSRYFHERTIIDIEKAVRFKRPLTLAYFDIDNFKQINDNYGHKRGDELLQAVVSIMKSNVRVIDVIGRMGGDEFTLLLPETDESQTKAVIERIRTGIVEGINSKENLSIAFSVGVITCVNAFLPVDDLIKAADNLMYTAKKNGKNAVEYKIYQV